MIKDKEWLKEKVKKNANKYPVYHDERDDLIKKMVDMHGVLKLIEQLDEPGKPVIPQFVAGWIENRRDDFEDGFGMAVYIDKSAWDDESHTEYDIYKWMKGKERLFIEAVEDGYEIEKEPLYTVCFEDKKNVYRTGIFLYKNDGKVNSGNAMDVYDKEDSESHLTEKEIKDYDERFWQFAVPVEEVTE